MRRRGAPRLLLAAAVAASAFACGYILWQSAAGRRLELQTVDARFAVRGARRPSPRVVVVGIDPRTLATLPRPPFSRRLDAGVIDRLRVAGAGTIAYDRVFDAPTSAPDDAALLRAAARAHGHIVLAGTATDARGNTFVLGGPEHQRRAGVLVGSANLPRDPDGVVRRLWPAVEGLQSFAPVAAGNAGLSPARIASLFGGHPLWIDLPGRAGTVPAYSYSDVLAGRVPGALLRGRVVVVGATASVLQDVKTVALSGSQPMSGPELQADAIATLLSGAPLRDAPTVLGWLVLAAAALTLPLVSLVRSWRWLVLAAAGAVTTLLVGVQVAFDDGLVVPLLPPLATLLAGGAGALVSGSALDRRDLRVLRDRFARFSPDLVDAVLARPQGALRLRAMAIGPESVIAGYRLEELAGRGGMGVVYRARQLALGREVALKLIDPRFADHPAFRERFVRESRASASLEHPHVIPIYEAGDDDGLLFIAMRFVRGPSLHRLLGESGPLPAGLAATLVAQIATALHAAHLVGIVHRDVKPANVLLVADPGCPAQHSYLTDFGVSREQGAGSLTDIGERVGTVDYMAPEQCRGEQAGPAADLYALGCILFEALCGRVPYPRENEAARILAHVSEQVPRPSDVWPSVPHELDAVVMRALAKAPDHRFGSCLELALVLTNWASTPAPVPLDASTRRRSIPDSEPTRRPRP